MIWLIKVSYAHEYSLNANIILNNINPDDSDIFTTKMFDIHHLYFKSKEKARESFDNLILILKKEEDANKSFNGVTDRNSFVYKSINVCIKVMLGKKKDNIITTIPHR